MEDQRDSGRERGKNFTETEKNLLVESVTSKYKHVIESKQTDGVTVAKKNLAWQEIAKEFNAQNQTGHRTAKQLHALYNNLKRTARTNLHSDKKNVYKTGGGTFTRKSTTLDEKIVTVLHDQFNPLSNKYDSSAEFLEALPGSSADVHSSNFFELQQPSCSGLRKSATKTTEDYSVEAMDIILPLHESSIVDESSISAAAEVEVEQCSDEPTQLPASTRRPQLKRKSDNAQIHKLSTKKAKCIEALSERFAQQKNVKDEHDREVHQCRIEILKVEKKIKLKQLEVAQQQLELKKIKCMNEQEKLIYDRKVREANLKKKDFSE